MSILVLRGFSTRSFAEGSNWGVGGSPGGSNRDSFSYDLKDPT